MIDDLPLNCVTRNKCPLPSASSILSPLLSSFFHMLHIVIAWYFSVFLCGAFCSALVIMADSEPSK